MTRQRRPIPRGSYGVIAVVGLCFAAGLWWQGHSQPGIAQHPASLPVHAVTAAPRPLLMAPLSTGPALPSGNNQRTADTDFGKVEARAIAFEFYDAKQNVFFNQDTFVTDVLDRDPDVVTHLEMLLMDDASLFGLDVQDNIRETRPSIVVDRMAAIDVLEALASSGTAGIAGSLAEATLANLIGRSLAPTLNDAAKRIVLAEQYDALTALVRANPSHAFELYAALKNDRLARMLEPAVVAGLIDKGVPMAEVGAMVADIRPSHAALLR